MRLALGAPGHGGSPACGSARATRARRARPPGPASMRSVLPRGLVLLPGEARWPAGPGWVRLSRCHGWGGRLLVRPGCRRNCATRPSWSASTSAGRPRVPTPCLRSRRSSACPAPAARPAEPPEPADAGGRGWTLISAPARLHDRAATWCWPGRASACASGSGSRNDRRRPSGSQSHGVQETITRPGPHGCPRLHCSGHFHQAGRRTSIG
jgi:hypothetical protein